MEVNGTEVTICDDSVTYLFKSEADANGFFKCIGDGSEFGRCLVKYNGMKKPKPTTPKR